MKRTWWRLCLSFFVGAFLTAGAVLLLLRVNANARPPAQGVSIPPPAANSANVTVGISDLTPYVTKGAIEMPTEQLLAVKTVPAPVEDVASWKELEEDTRLNERTRRLQIHELLACSGLVQPEKVTRPMLSICERGCGALES